MSKWWSRQPVRFSVQNTDNQDAYRSDWVWMQNRGRGEGYAKWNREKYTGNQQWQEGNRDSNQWSGPEGRNKHSTRTEWTNKNLKKKNEERLSTLWDNLKHSNIWIIGVPEGEEEDKEIENLFEKIMKGNVPNLAKEIDFQEVQEAQRVSKKLEPRSTHQGTLRLH